MIRLCVVFDTGKFLLKDVTDTSYALIDLLPFCLILYPNFLDNIFNLSNFSTMK
jgi:hypothetical protein